QPYGTPPPQYGTPYPQSYAQKKKTNPAIWLILVAVIAVLGIGGFLILSGGNNNATGDATATATQGSSIVLRVSETPDATEELTPSDTPTSLP
ncbi:MAG TPA: hypothetical protein PLZ51_15060, partial [Aggregatilineales bacterium]|nr:hypothetical protein [Aggregatilineales bacterium]